MSGWLDHLIILPILLPLAAGMVMLLFDDRSRTFKALVNLSATFALVVLAVALLRLADARAADGEGVSVGAYLLGNWPAPFGIVLVLDRLSALMLLLTSILAAAAMVFSLAHWHRVGVHFHALFQFLLMGLNGAFLTGDLFNLFVFFEVMLAASYGLVLHGSGIARVRAGMHYIVVNLTNTVLFLIGVSLIYGVTGTLNMADLAVRIPQVAPEDRVLLEAGAAFLGIAFLVKSGMWPFSFWLPPAYAAASPPVAAIFSILTKVGVYVVLRLWLLLFGSEAGASAGFGGEWLLVGGLMTVLYGSLGVLASQDTGRLASFYLLISSGTLLAALGMGDITVTGTALFYLVSSTLGISAFFLLIELVERGREAGADMLAVTMEAYGEPDEGDPEADSIGFSVPATMSILGIAFVCCALLLSGMPPLPGFIAKFALLTAILDPGLSAVGTVASAGAWIFLTLVIVSGLAALIATTRAGIRSFWLPIERAVPRVNVIEMAPVAVLLALCLALTFQAGTVMRYMEATASDLHAPQHYIQGVLSAPPASGARQEAGR